MELLDEVITMARVDCAARAEEHRTAVVALHGLTWLLLIRFREIVDVAVLDEVIALSRAVLACLTPKPSERARSCADLAWVLVAQKTSSIWRLSEAIELRGEALSLYPDGHPDRGGTYLQPVASLWQLCGSARDQYYCIIHTHCG
jgi:hypothetical protein